MTTPSQILWREAREPREFIDGLEPVEASTCAVCGATIDEGVDLDDTFGGNEDGWESFADKSSEWVCAGCHFLSKGRWKDQFRLWSIIWSEAGGLPDHYPSVYETIDEASYPVRLEPLVENGVGRVQITCRGAVLGVLDLLLDPPPGRWFAMLTTSGQKKIHRFTPLTSGDPYKVQLDQTAVRTSSLDFAETLYHAAVLRKMGVSEDRVRSGRLDAAYDRKHARHVQWHSRQLDAVRGHPRLELALFCLTQESINDAGRRARRALERRGSARSWCPPAAGDAGQRGHRRDRAQRLVEARAGRLESGSGDERQPPSDGQQNGGQAGGQQSTEADGPRDQLDLFSAE